METQDKLNKGIGTKETEQLQAAMVEILECNLIAVKPKSDGSTTSEKVECLCKYPGKEGPIKISSVKYLKDDKVKQSGLWYKLDEDELISKQSALAEFLRYLKCENINEVKGKTIMTDLDSKGFLAFKLF